MKTDVKVGIFALLVLALLAYMTFKVGGLGFIKKKGYSVNVYFRNVTGLDKKSRVRVAGVDVGFIENITLKNGKARLVLRINPSVVLYSDASATIKTVGLLGERYLDMSVGHTPPPLKDGDTIKNVIETVDVDDVIRSLSAVSTNIDKFMTSMNKVLSEEQIESFKETVQSFKEMAENANTAIKANDMKVRKTLDTLDSFVTRLDNMVATNQDSVRELVANMRDFSETLKRDAPVLMSDIKNTTGEIRGLVSDTRPKLESIVDRADRLTSEIEQGKGTLGKLIKDEKLYNNVSGAAEGLSTTLGAINRFKLFLDFQGQQLTGVNDSKGAFFLTLQPRPNKYYIFGVTEDPIGHTETKTFITNGVSVTTDTIEQDIEFTAQYARRFKNTALRIGLTENTFGVGADQYFFNDKMRIFADAWDFTHKEAFSKHPHVTVGMDYFLFKNLYLSAGMDNLLNSRWMGPFFGGGVRFEDEDLKYLLGVAPRP